MTVFFIKFFPLKNALGKEKKESTKKSNNNFKSFPKISEKEILGIEKYLLKRWIYKKTKFQKIIKAQLKNKSYYNKKKKNYEKKMISKNFGKTFSYIIEKISEDEKLFSKNMNFNPANLRINGVQLITLQKNNGKLKKKFFIKEKNYKFLKYMNKFSIFNPDFQSCSSILSSSSEIKKITGLKDFILLDPLKAFLFQSFSSYSGCFFFENNLANRSLLGFETKKITIAESKEIEKKKSFLFRKKKFKSKKNIISKKKISVLPKKFNLKNLITKKTRQKNHFKEKSGKKIKFHSNKYYEGENKKISKANMNRINSKKKENRSFFKYISYKKISKKNFPNFLRKFKEIYLDKLNEKKKKELA